nr:hypothetical protein B0A51_08742 [Rachicladosporium sp. CCFEE 5018]
MRATDLFAYEYFRKETAEPLQLFQPAGAWVRLALQMSLESDAVLRGIMAVGVAHRAYISVTNTSLSVLMLTEDKVLARKLYGEALTALQRYIEKAKHRAAPIEPISVASLLLITFETIFQDKYVAFAHFPLAQKLVDQLHDTKITEESKPKVQSCAAATQLSATFDRLRGELTPLLDSMQITDLPRHCAAPLNHRLDVRLAHLIVEHDAILQGLRTLAAPHWAHRSDFDRAVRLCLTYCHSRSIALPPNSTLPSRISSLLDNLHAWSEVVKTYPNHASRYLQLLRIRHFTTLFCLSTCRATSETPTDALTANFNATLNTIESYLSSSDPAPDSPPRIPSLPNPPNKPPTPQLSFSLDHGLLPALHLIATKCRALPTRLRAIALLRAHRRREGLRLSSVVAAVAESVIALEETRAADTWPMPEGARFAETVICGQRADARRVRLVCGRFEAGSRGRRVVIEEFEGQGSPLCAVPVGLRVWDLGGVEWEGGGGAELGVVVSCTP